MYRCNLAKFQQNDDFRRVLLGGRGPITAYGAPFWAKWNSIILERIREELRPEGIRDEAIIATATRWMNEYREAALLDDQYKIEVRVASSLPQLGCLALQHIITRPNQFLSTVRENYCLMCMSTGLCVIQFIVGNWSDRGHTQTAQAPFHRPHTGMW